MSQAFADDEHAAGGVLLGHLNAGTGPAITPGKGVRAVRCLGCRSDTLPRPEDGAPLCRRCSDLLAAAEPETWGTVSAWSAWSPRWLRRRSSVYS